MVVQTLKHFSNRFSTLCKLLNTGGGKKPQRYFPLWTSRHNNISNKRTYRPSMDTLEDRVVPTTSNAAFSDFTYFVNEDAGSASITVILDQAVTQTSSVDWSTIEDTATADSDYSAVSGTITWQPSDGLSKSFAVPIIDDSIFESDEAFWAALSNPTGDIVLDVAVYSVTQNWSENAKTPVNWHVCIS